MRKIITATAAVVALAASVLVGTAGADAPSCNWGELTADAVGEGFDQGGHASDPSGDGHGPGTLDEPRARARERR